MNFYQKFIHNFSNITHPLYAPLTHKTQQWVWGPAEQEAFNALKKAVTSAPILTFSSQSSVDGEVNQPMLLILNQLQLKNHRIGLRRLSQVYPVLTVTRKIHKDRILDIKLEKVIPVLPQWKAAPLVCGSTTVAHTGGLYSCHSPSLKAYASYVH